MKKIYNIWGSPAQCISISVYFIRNRASHVSKLIVLKMDPTEMKTPSVENWIRHLFVFQVKYKNVKSIGLPLLRKMNGCKQHTFLTWSSRWIQIKT